jgi:membrane-associated phospholipid phosphatase
MLASAQQAWCSGLNEKKFAKDASNSIAPFLVVTELSLATDGKSAKPEMVQGAKALLATTVITQALKYTVREKRPNSESLSSFPSGHTSSAFAMATVVADYKPKYKWLAYGAASVIGWSRVEVGAHRWHDVLAGAAIGYVTAKHFTNQHFSVSPNGTVGYSWKW